MLRKLAAAGWTLAIASAVASAQAARNARIDVTDIKVAALVNLNTQSLRAEATIAFLPLDLNSQSVHFELNEALKVSKVTDAAGQPLNATRVGEHTLRINFSDPFSKGESKTVVITYDGRLAGQEESPVFGIRFAAIRQDFAYLLAPARWFPVNEYIVDRYSSEFTVGVPEGYRVVGGGVETKEQSASGEIYRIKYTQPGFGGSLAIVKQDPVRVTSQGATTAVYFRDAAAQAQAYGEETGKILTYFTGLFGTPPSTSLTLVETEKGGPSGWSGPGIIFLSPGTIGSSVNSRGLSNQIARQWWGQWLSPASRNHLWITNGMARYAELMYLEQGAGPSVFAQDIRDSYIEALTMNEVPLIQSARLEDFSPEYWALTGAKGATVYHMARQVMGDEKFWQAIKQFLAQNGNKSVTTEQLRQTASNVLGEDLGYFFIQWIESSGAPEFKLQYTVFRTQQGFRIVGKVAQDLDTFRMPVNLKIETEGNPETTKVEIAGTSSEFAINTFGKPTKIILDPDGAVLRWSDDIRVAVAIRRGEQFAEVNDFGEALKEYQKALDVRRMSSLAHYRIAEIFFLQNNYQSAANAFREALNGDLEPKWTEVWSRINLGKIFDVTGQRDRAVNEYNLALRTKDNTQDAQEEAAKFLKQPYRRAVAGN
jgi:hypothetical protein